ncbi:MAG: STAS domain-containing protein [Bryobacteraceae bacterium]
MEIRQREREGIVILDLTGELTVGGAASALREKLRELGEAGRNRIVLNLAGVEFIDSTGLGAMVVCYTTLQKAGGRLVLLNLKRRQLELLVLTKLSTVFEVFDDEQDAVNSFFPGRQVHRFDILQFIERQRQPSGEPGS